MDDEDQIEVVARVLCARAGRDPDGLEPGNIVILTGMDEDRFQAGAYDHMWDDGSIPPDGTARNGDPCHYNWREYVFTARAVLRAIEKR